MRARIRSAAVSLLLLAACSPEPERCDDHFTRDPDFPVELAAALDEVMTLHAPYVGAPGTTLTVSVPGVGEHATAWGLASLSSLEPLEPRARFRVGSITKSFTAATLLRMQEEGLLSLDDTVVSHLPWLAPELDPGTTLTNLLQHTSGIYNYTDDAGFLFFIRMPWTPEEIISWALDESRPDHGQTFAPGAAYSYSNTGYHVAGLVVEQVAGVPFHEAMRTRTIDAASLEDTGLDRFDPPTCGMVDGHLYDSEVATDRMDPIWSWAAGGVVSNGLDLCRWARALYLGDVLTSVSRDLLVTPSAESTASGYDPYGMATRHTTRAGRQVIGHTGSTMGFNAELYIDPTDGTCVAVLTNDFLGRPREVAEPAWALLDGL